MVNRVFVSARRLIFVLVAALSAGCTQPTAKPTQHAATEAQHAAAALRPVHTYSIIARDPLTGELGAAVHSHWFNVGANVIWAQSGIGAVATQSFLDPDYGPMGLELMRIGRSAPDSLKALLSIDGDREVRQVAMVDSRGRATAHTGKLCIEAAGHEVGEGFSVQANMMGKPSVWGAMAQAYRETKGELVERLMAALKAAEREGGDFRGRQSAAILVVRGKSTGSPWEDRLFDLRVEDHPDPVRELERLVVLRRAYRMMDAGDEFMVHQQWQDADNAYRMAAEIAPQVAEITFWRAVALVNAGKLATALPIFKQVFQRDATWRSAIRRLSRAKQLPREEQILRQIEAQ